MRYQGPIYRPPSEAGSLLIQATLGCPHNKCTFCMIYKNGPRFKIRSLDAIEADLQQARRIYGHSVRTLFLPAGNTIAMPTGQLAAVCRSAREIFPHLERSRAHARNTADALNQVDPDFIRLRTFVPKVNTPLLVAVQDGSFRVMGPHGILKETAMLIRHLAVTSQLTSDHYTNYLNLHGRLPEAKPRLLSEIAAALLRDESEFRSFFIGSQ